MKQFRKFSIRKLEYAIRAARFDTAAATRLGGKFVGQPLGLFRHLS
jgi:hypothetical protein